MGEFEGGKIGVKLLGVTRKKHVRGGKKCKSSMHLQKISRYDFFFTWLFKLTNISNLVLKSFGSRIVYSVYKCYIKFIIAISSHWRRVYCLYIVYRYLFLYEFTLFCLLFTSSIHLCNTDCMSIIIP